MSDRNDLEPMPALSRPRIREFNPAEAAVLGKFRETLEDGKPLSPDMRCFLLDFFAKVPVRDLRVMDQAA